MKSLFVLVIALVAFTAAFLLYFLFSFSFQIKSANAQPLLLNSTDIALRSLLFVQNFKRTDGLYDYSYDCANSSCTMDQTYTDETNAWPILAYAGLYQSTGNSAYLSVMNGDLSNLEKYCTGSSCMEFIAQLVKAYKISGNPEFLTFAKKMGDVLLSNNNETGIMIKGVEAQEFALLYEATSDQKYLNEAQFRLAESKADWGTGEDTDVVFSSGNFSYYRYACWTELGQFEIAKATNNSTMMQDVQNFFVSANFASSYVNIEYLSALQPCVETLLLLHNQTGNIQYYNEAKTVMQYTVTYRWDAPFDIAKKYNGDGGYLYEFFSSNNTKSITDASYMIYLLTSMPNENFNIVKWN